MRRQAFHSANKNERSQFLFFSSHFIIQLNILTYFYCINKLSSLVKLTARKSSACEKIFKSKLEKEWPQTQQFCSGTYTVLTLKCTAHQG